MENGEGLEKADCRKIVNSRVRSERIQRKQHNFRASGPISRILSSRLRAIAAWSRDAVLSRGGDHSSGPPIARRLGAAYPRVSWERREALSH